MRTHLSFLTLTLWAAAHAMPALADTVAETVYVETTLDTDQDGKPDLIYVEVNRPQGQTNLPTIYTISPYSLGGNDAPNHGVDVTRLPQEGNGFSVLTDAGYKLRQDANKMTQALLNEAADRGYATVSAHSLGTGRSTGCPTVGDQSETLAAKAVIDWLNGRAKAHTANGQNVVASWANGSVGMTGVSYNGTLPNMVASTGVDGLKAIVPISAISNWYDYYRANGLVVSPGGYIGEDADVLGQYIVRQGACSGAIKNITATMGRENGDFTPFWQARNYVDKAANVKAAVFIIHGQTDWNVKERHAIQWWDALYGHTPLRMWLHKGGHGNSSRFDQTTEIYAWFDHYVKGTANGVEDQAPIEVESPDGKWATQQSWPHESTATQQLFMNPGNALATTAAAGAPQTITDAGNTVRLEAMIDNPATANSGRLAFVTPAFAAPRMISGTSKVQLTLSVLNRKAANVTVALVDYDANGRGRVVTRGWADPQNSADWTHGEVLELGKTFTLAFELEPKQYTFAQGHRLGVVFTATDYEYTLRPQAGTQLSLAVGSESWVTVNLSGLN